MPPDTPTVLHRLAKRICPLCEACCGLTLRIGRDEHGEYVAGVRGNDDDVFSRGYLCPKGVALKDLHEDPDRLRAPLIKRAGVFVESSWEEAFAEIARRMAPLQTTGDRDAFALSLGNPTAHKIGLLLYGARLARALGTRNVFSASTLDQMPRQLVNALLYGHWLSNPLPDIERTELLVVLGANPLASNGSMWTVPDFRGKAKALRARGGKLIVIDPRRSETAEVADEHLFVRPGADVFLLLGLVQTLFAEQRVRLGALAEHLTGLAEVEAAVREYSPEVVAGRCGIGAERIRALAHELANTPRAVLYGRIGTCTQRFGTLATWLIDLVNILTGHLDVEGGAMFAKAAAFAANTQGKPGSGRGVTTGRHHARVSGAPEVYGELPMGALAEEIETPGRGQVRALFTIASNPVLSAPDGPRLARALEQLDFMVSVDIYLNETTRHADVILPGRSPLEDAHFDVAFPQLSYRNHARYSAPVFAPTPGQPAEWEILLRLAAIARGEAPDADIDELDEAAFAGDAERLLTPFGAATRTRVKSALAGRRWGIRDACVAPIAGARLCKAEPGQASRTESKTPEPRNAPGFARRGPDRLIDFALRSGPYGDKFGQNPDGLTLAKLEAAPDGIDLGALQPRIPEMLRTPGSKIELAPPMLLDDLRRAAAALAEPAPDMVIVGRREVRSNNSWMHNLPTLAKGQGKYETRCTLLVHPDDARRHGLVDGGVARIASAHGEISAPVEISTAMMPGVVSLPHGWGHDLPGTRLDIASRHPGANLNALFDPQDRDPLSGNAVLSGVPVRLHAS